MAAVVPSDRGTAWICARRTAWLLGGVVIVLLGARWGTEVGTSRRIQELEERLRILESEQLDWRKREKEEQDREEICITSVNHEVAGWRFLRGDGSEAAFIALDHRNITPVDSEAIAARRVR